jgi:putative proteasome-type protease
VTYCVALATKNGFVMLSDTRTNAGIDNISTFGKMHLYEATSDRVIALMSAGNLATSQAVVNLLNEGIERADGTVETLYTVTSMFKAAQLVGEAIRRIYAIDGPAMREQNVSFDVSMVIGGQLKNRAMRVFQIYSAGNFIEATPDTPFLQIGEHKYGKPILDRTARFDTELYDGVKLLLISMDSTLRSNLTVGMPADLVVYRRDTLKIELRRRITEEDSYFRMIRDHWSEALREAYRAIPRPNWGM